MGTRRVSVMGCGWLGLPLAAELVKRGYSVKGSTTTPAKISALQEKGIEPFLISFPEITSKTLLIDFLTADVLAFNLPPSRSASDQISYEQIVKTILEVAPESLQAILFVSSTAVYPELNRVVTEQDAVATSDAPSLLLRCEYLAQSSSSMKATIVRMGGLMGGTRHPGRFLAGRKEVSQPASPVNMIHLSDCVGLLTKIIEQDKWGFTFNACAPKHPSREAFYTLAAQQITLDPPSFARGEALQFKEISSDFIQRELNYAFLYPDPLLCLSSASF